MFFNPTLGEYNDKNVYQYRTGNRSKWAAQ